MIRRPRSGQRGAVSVLAVLLIATIAMAALVSIDLGNVFYRQRQLQSMVDLAALSAAQQLKQAGTTAAQTASTLASAQAIGRGNGYPGAASTDCSLPGAGGADGMKVCLGVWDPSYSVAGDASHFNASYNTSATTANAVRVTATQTVPVLFVIPGSSSRQLRAQAVAVGSPPTASFSIGSGLLDVGTANSLLSLLLGRTVQLSVADWNGLVNAKVSLAQLQLQAKVGSIQQLLNTSLSISDFYALVLGAAGQSSLLSTLLGGVPVVGVNAAQATVSLAQLLNLGVLAPAQSAAANVGLSVSSLLTLAAQVANGGSAVSVPTLGLKLPTNVASVQAQLYVTQPPVMAAGPVLQLSGAPPTWATTAHTAQVGVTLNVQGSTNVDLGPLGLLVALVNQLVSVTINVPLYVEVAAAQASLQGLQCTSDLSSRRATLGVSTSIVTACLGKGDGTPGCGTQATLVDAPVLGGLVQVTITATGTPSKIGSANQTLVTLAPGGTAHVGTSQVIAGLLTDVVGNIVPTVTLSVAKIPILGLPIALAPLLQPLAAPLDGLLTPLLNGLGLQLGTADVWLNDISCKNSDLVY
ncbi:hypothetical protein BKK81_20820 [Cupriavidus sp. USMAHM13]|uniref:TadG family pilus assembly protein n=1 Tax=Cupriavidus sp. USMAHM13 TaxID=1389192 RepID=UPI0008A66951|nr:TadG family pilus assembly protein [Cupriavidus sp. USMAHM13]AOZ01813.1 hypothetical protein BKK81_20820 [Cupriavidus sp. USMAHM13]